MAARVRVRPAGLDADDEHHDRGAGSGEPQREHAARGEQRDHGQEELRHREEDDRLRGGPAERGEAVQDVVLAVFEQRSPAPQPVPGDHAAVEQEDAEEDQRSGELTPRHGDWVHGEAPTARVKPMPRQQYVVVEGSDITVGNRSVKREMRLDPHSA